MNDGLATEISRNENFSFSGRTTRNRRTIYASDESQRIQDVVFRYLMYANSMYWTRSDCLTGGLVTICIGGGHGIALAIEVLH
jgi:hypothetical protein